MDTASLKKLGFALMSAGFLGGAYTLVQYPEKIAWVPYGILFAVTAAGSAMLRVAQGKSGGETAKVSADIDTIRQSLEELVEKVTAINRADREGDKLFGVCQQIDTDCMDPINAFVDAREAMIHRFGLAPYATMMDSFALGERALNRAWCASADGYIDEVNLCLDRAENHLQKALTTVEECVATGQSSDVPYRDAAARAKRS